MTPEREPSSERPVWHDIGALVAYALLAVAATWPTMLHFATQALGEHYFDRVQNTWNLWWVKTALLDLHTNPYHTNLLLYPGGVDLYFHTLNLPSTLLSLPVQLLAGPVAAYNFSMMAAVALSAYAAYRLARYLTGSYAGALLAGIVYGFSPIAIFHLRGQTQMVSMEWMPLCIEFYLRAWNRDGATLGRVRRDAILAGVFFVLSLLVVGYFEVQLLIFFAVHAVWWLATSAGNAATRLRSLLWQARPALMWSLPTAALLAAPYLIGAWLSLQKGEVVPTTADDFGRATADSADLLGFFVPSPDHWLFGPQMPWWDVISRNIHPLAYLGVTTVVLAAIGARFAGVRRASLWLGVAALYALLALGPVLRVNDMATGVPMPFALLQRVPVLGLVRAPERFMISVYLALGVLAAYGVAALLRSARLARFTPTARALGVTAGAAALLLFEMPLHQRHTEALPTSPTLQTLAAAQPNGAVIELPLTQHGWVDTNRMAYQIEHGRPITSAYVSRPVINPYEEACSSLRALTLPVEEGDIVPPIPSNDLLALLRRDGFTHVMVYKQAFYSPTGLSPVPEGQLAELQAEAASLGARTADDDLATLYTLNPVYAGPVISFLQLGTGWHAPEGRPFRWMDGADAQLCVGGSPTGGLRFTATSFARPRHLQLWVGENMAYEVEVPADGAMHEYQVDLFMPDAPQPVRLVVPEGSDSPAALGQGGDTRQLSIGFGPITTWYPIF